MPNTTQNKEELNINDLLDTFESDVICELGIEPDGDNLSVKTTDEVVEALQPVVEELLIQAHQSGIEEGKKAERNEIYRILSEELSVAYPDPRTGFRDMIEMEVEDLINQIDKSLKENKQ